jgi:hypothetical protein
MGQSLTLLKGGPPIDPDLLKRVIEADRKTINFVLTDPTMLEHGKNYTNQYTNVFAGALAFLALYPDVQLRKLLEQRMTQTSEVFQSPAGYFYEARGPDWGYNLGTHHSNLWMCWHYTRGTPLGRLLVEEERKYVDWLAYNAVRELDGSGYTLNRAIETRQQRAFLDTTSISRSNADQGQRLLASEVSLARAFAPTLQEINRDRTQQRSDLEKNWKNEESLVVGEFRAFSPYTFLHRDHVKWFPSDAERDSAVQQLPYLREREFIRQRMDSRERLVFTYVRRPAYYAIFNSGPHLTAQQRYGIGLIWDPTMGTVVQSQTGTDNAAWGTVLGQNKGVFEADSINAVLSVNGKPSAPVPGTRDLRVGILSVRYSFTDQGEKSIEFDDRVITVEVQHSGLFREQIPLLVGKNDSVKTEPGRVTLIRGNRTLTINFDAQARAETTGTTLTVGKRSVVVINLTARNSLRYRIEFQL